MTAALSQHDVPGEPVARLELSRVNGCVDIAPDGTTKMLLWDGSTTIALDCGAEQAYSAALSGSLLLGKVVKRLQLEMRAQYDRLEEAVVDSPHLPRRPTWNCCECGDPWPCQNRRAELTYERRIRPALVCAVQVGHLMQAADDLPDIPLDELHHRFLGCLQTTHSNH